MIESLPITELDFECEHTIWDVREPKAFAERHVKGAVNHPIDELTQALLDDTSGTIHVLCGGGTRAKKAAERLHELDPSRNIVILKGGTRKAVAQNLPTVSASAN